MKKIKIGVIGAGRIGKVHVAALAQGVPAAEVLVIADTDINSARQLAEKYGIAEWTTDYKKVIHNPEVEAIIICSPTDTHAKYIIETAQAGKHIFCEKPIDLSIPVIQSALEAVKKAGVKFMVGF
ncbi:MAG: Gfo/Idh/MocA family oxidoreductase, partial [Salinivirgaceae bacterium]|nr:Gfo/Idh/MocA family oxidoreductase [Salinivirgaceae bacterium]